MIGDSLHIRLLRLYEFGHVVPWDEIVEKMGTDMHPSGRFSVTTRAGDLTVTDQYYIEGVTQTEVSVDGATAKVYPDTYNQVVNFYE